MTEVDDLGSATDQPAIDRRAADLATALALEQLDRDLFRGVNTVSAFPRTTLFGGQVAGQALMAAGSTVPEGRLPHSLHGYFLRPGRTDRRVIFQVDRDRDGRSFSARHVAAVQDGEVIFSMLASFHDRTSEGVVDATPKPDVFDAEACRSIILDPLVEIREVSHSERLGDVYRLSDCLWVRSAHPLPPDRLTHAAALAYISDYGSGFGQMFGDEVGHGGPSIDHAVWFHEPIVADDWVLLNMWPIKAVESRGLYQGSMRARDGRLGGTLAQEHLFGRRM